jgi:hypothetical protein
MVRQRKTYNKEYSKKKKKRETINKRDRDIEKQREG